MPWLVGNVEHKDLAMQTQPEMVNNLFLLKDCSLNHWYQKNTDFSVLVNNQYLSRCVLWGAHSVRSICLPLSPARAAPDSRIFSPGPEHQGTQDGNVISHSLCQVTTEPPELGARCSEMWGRWSHVKNHGPGAHTQGTFLQRADDKGACSGN